MKCRRAGKMIPLYAGGELSGIRARRLERHLEECSDCRKMVEEFRAALAGLRTAARRDEYDWPAAEWMSLMTRIKTQAPPRRAIPLGMRPKTAWAYGAAVVLLLGLSAFILWTRLFPPAPVQPTEILASTEVQPGRPLEFADSQFSRLWQDNPFQVRAERPRAIQSETLIAASTGGKESQDLLSMTLVSQDTGLKVHWTFNRNFEWKEEEKR
ncbi:MAG: zf-HC2 domain-containing protein [Candidatus Aminicenantales bacterium]